MDSEKQFTPPNGFAQLLGIGRTNGDGLLGVGLLGVGRTVFSSFRERGFGGMVPAKITGENHWRIRFWTLSSNLSSPQVPLVAGENPAQLGS